MSRLRHLLKGISKSQFGLEIAPYHSPLAPKSDGYNCLVLDVFDTETLIQKGSIDPNVPLERMKNIETVDVVGSATEIATLIKPKLHGTFDYVISSHNFEHLANPIRFLQGCESLLKPGGTVSMAVPDCRACFDYYRPVTLLSEWLAGYREGREKPTPEQVFAMTAYASVLKNKKGEKIAFTIDDPMREIEIKGELSKSYDVWRNTVQAGPYIDAHCTVMTPTSLRLLLEESRQLGLLKLEILEVSPAHGCEFFVRLRNPSAGAIILPTIAAFHQRRTELMRKAARERFTTQIQFPFKKKLKRAYYKLSLRLGRA